MFPSISFPAKWGMNALICVGCFISTEPLSFYQPCIWNGIIWYKSKPTMSCWHWHLQSWRNLHTSYYERIKGRACTCINRKRLEPHGIFLICKNAFSKGHQNWNYWIHSQTKTASWGPSVFSEQPLQGRLLLLLAELGWLKPLSKVTRRALSATQLETWSWIEYKGETAPHLFLYIWKIQNRNGCRGSLYP